VFGVMEGDAGEVSGSKVVRGRLNGFKSDRPLAAVQALSQLRPTRLREPSSIPRAGLV